jgi:hypothetical protein
MKNAQPRFALDDDGNIYVYASGTNVPPTGNFTDDAGTWDLGRVKTQILSGQPIETALNSLAAKAPQPAPPPAPVVDKVAQADQDFLDHPA